MVVDSVEEGKDGRPVGEDGDMDGYNGPTKQASGAKNCRLQVAKHRRLTVDDRHNLYVGVRSRASAEYAGRANRRDRVSYLIRQTFHESSDPVREHVSTKTESRGGVLKGTAPAELPAIR